MLRGGLRDALAGGLKALKGDATLTRDNLKEPLKAVRRALLEADVALPVVKAFLARVEDSAAGTAVPKKATPDQLLVKLVNDELVALLGGKGAGELDLPPKTAARPAVVLMAGLQGVGKTTTAAKLARLLQTERKPMLVAADVYRPAAAEQLQVLGDSLGVPVVMPQDGDGDPVWIAKAGLRRARAEGCDVVIVDTAGRTQLDAELMDELKAVRDAVAPADETLLVVDAMTGQEAAAAAKAFNDAVGITGVVLSKADGDSRGGAALSVRGVSGAPIKFVGNGEGVDALEQFYPERLASRILGMGDVVSLVEKLQQSYTEEEAETATQRIMEGKYTLTDFRQQMEMVGKMGNVSGLAQLMPGMPKVDASQMAKVDAQFAVQSSIIDSMTASEQEEPVLVSSSASRRRRIARGSGRSEAQVTELMNQYFSIADNMKRVGKMMKSGQGAQLMQQMMSGGGGMQQAAGMQQMMAGMGGAGGMRPKKGKAAAKAAKNKAAKKAAKASSGAKKGFGRR